ncbi:DUF4382 domain-containing protein [Parapedobacter sp.]
MKKQVVLPLLTLTAVLGLLFFSGCEKNPSNSGETAEVSLRLTDAPAAFDGLLLDVQGIEFHTDEAGWVSVDPIVPGVYDILDYRNGADTLLARTTLPVGRLSQVRFLLGDDNAIVIDGVEHPLEVPSGESSGLKFNVHQELAPNGSYEFWTDLDAARSIVQTGNGDYKLKPVIRVFTQLTNGRIKGMVQPMDANPIVYAINETDTVSAIPEADGFFLLQGLSEGSYTLRIEPDEASGLAVYEQTVPVAFGVVSDVETINLEQ